MGYFEVSASPSMETVALAAGVATYDVHLKETLINILVSFSVAGLPPGSTGQFHPSQLGVTGDSQLIVSFSDSTPKGTYTLSITGSSQQSGSETVNVQLILV